MRPTNVVRTLISQVTTRQVTRSILNWRQFIGASLSG